MKDGAIEVSFLGLGTNRGDRQENLNQAFNGLNQIPFARMTNVSACYETSAVGPIEQESFLNAAAKIETSLEPQALLDQLRRIESELGRPDADQRQRWGPRVIDLDILLFGQRVIDQPGLQVPHPRMHERWFVLKPLADLAPDLMHPVLGKTISQLLAELTSSDQNRAL